MFNWNKYSLSNVINPGVVQDADSMCCLCVASCYLVLFSFSVRFRDFKNVMLSFLFLFKFSFAEIKKIYFSFTTLLFKHFWPKV